MIRIFTFFLLLSIPTLSQKWQRKEIKNDNFTLFHSTQALNHKTGQVVPKGDLFYGISHRFITPMSEGWSDFYGLDGGATMRTKLGYGITDNFMATVGRSNRDGQLDLNMKYMIYKNKESLGLPIIISFNGGFAYTQKGVIQEVERSRRFQYYGTAIFNTMLFDRVAIGLNPTFFYNSLVNSVDIQSTILLGYYIQWYIGNDITSFIFESTPTLAGFRGNGSQDYYTTYAFGVEFETGGHFFKLMVTNNTFINHAQFFQGAPHPLNFENLRFGFQITRNFGFLL